MSDDQQPGGPPPRPIGGPPVFLPQGAAAGLGPDRGDSRTVVTTAAGAERWTARTGLLAAVIGFVGAQFAIVVLAVLYLAAGGEIKDPAFIVVATLVQAIVFAAAAVAMARTTGPVSVRDFGLVRARLGPTIGKTLIIALAYFMLLVAYASLVHLTPDDAPDKLGAGDGMLGMAGFALAAALVAPVAEEFFFRGMVFRSFANSIGVVAGAIVSGIFFGVMHIDSLSSERLLQVVPLAMLGVFFALLYHWSGTLYAPIAVHATNNAIAVVVFANDKHSGFGVALGACIWLLLMAFCLFGWRLTDRPRKPPPVAPENPMAPHGWG